jgi:uncharacterized protein (TIGR03083 family)
MTTQIAVETEALEAQCRDLVALVGELTEADFERPTRCPGWTVKELVAHCEGMLHRLVGENTTEVDGAPEIDRVGYYGYDPDGPREGSDPSKTFSEVIAERVVEEVGGRSGADLTASLSVAASKAIRDVGSVPPGRVIKRSGHPRMTYGEFIASRVLEFGVHTMDIGHATLRGERVHPDAVPVITGILHGLLDAPLPVGMGWDDRTFILTGTGRRALEPNERFALGLLAEKFPLLR